MPRNREEVLKTLQENQAAIRGFGVQRLGLFGSIARGEGNPGSDLDFLVELKRNTFDAYMDLKFFLEGLFHCSVDLVLSGSVKPALRDSILRETVYVPGL
ncbi:MAG: nucleotidyltransferase family protein [Candidatus Omnitrophota bacterium]|nr:nucleotidyltransferase family protein [Candidatus Omnitrophota bacterium]